MKTTVTETKEATETAPCKNLPASSGEKTINDGNKHPRYRVRNGRKIKKNNNKGYFFVAGGW